MWHLDTEVHEKMEVRNVRKLNLDFIIYGDTDSSEKSTKLIINDGQNIYRIRFDDLFKMFSEREDIFLDFKGNEVISPNNLLALNYTEELKFSKVKKIIRHKVRKPKWKITTESGKEVIVTNDHSLTVFRGGKKIHIKPSEINLETDEILSVDVDI
jgi:intein/homing endonuclease